MRLRLRLGLVLFALVVPFGLILSLVQLRWEARQLERRIYEAASAFMDQGGRERCEADPEIWPRHPRRHRRPRHKLHPRPPHREGGRHHRFRGLRAEGGRAYAYDADLRSENPRAPRIPEALSRELESGRAIALRKVGEGRQAEVEALVRMPWDDGPCARILVERPVPDEAPALLRVMPSMAVAAATILIALLAVGPIVRRIRRLTGAVRLAHDSPDARVQLDGADELTELAEAFDESQRRIRAQMGELERREQALRDFVADTTHDVMLPLTVLQGYLTSLERQTGAGEPLSSEILHGALEESHYLASMVQNLGAAARLEAGEALSSLSNVDLNALVGRVIARHRRIADQRGLALEFAVPEAPITLWADVTLLEQALSNLVHNAVRYGHRGGHVAVILERRDGGRAFSLRVLDDGPGIPAHHLARITERGYRGDRARSRSTQAEGLGLGLHIVRDVAERHGLTLDLRPGEEGGLVAELQGPLGEGSSGAAT